MALASLESDLTRQNIFGKLQFKTVFSKCTVAFSSGSESFLKVKCCPIKCKNQYIIKLESTEGLL